MSLEIERLLNQMSMSSAPYFGEKNFGFKNLVESKDIAQRSFKIAQEYAHVKDLPALQPSRAKPTEQRKVEESPTAIKKSKMEVEPVQPFLPQIDKTPISQALMVLPSQKKSSNPSSSRALSTTFADLDRPKWHAPWKLSRVISGHLGWVRCVAVDVSNEWFVTGSADRTVKIWDLASGKLKLTLTGHISTVRGVCVSNRHPYFFTCSEDKSIKCWDLEQNKVVRQYHGHLSGVYCISLHPGLDVLVSGGRDSTARVWDMRTRAAIHVLSGHTNTISSVLTQTTNPQVVTGSQDCQVRLWDLAAGKCDVILTHHKKSIRSLVAHPTLNMFASGAPDHIKQWKGPDGNFMQNLSGHNSIIHSLALNQDDVLVSCGDNGSMYFWDWKSAYCFQRLQTVVQPGSLESEAGVLCATFDQTGSRLIVGEADKSIKIYKEDDRASEETHPIDKNWKQQLLANKFGK